MATPQIYVCCGAGNMGYVVSVFAPNPTGTSTESPVAGIVGANTELTSPYGVALDASGRVYVSDDGNGINAPSIYVYAANPVGFLNESPVATITGSNTGLVSPTYMAFDANGYLYVLDDSTDSVLVYPPVPIGGGTLNETPYATITGSNTTMYGAIGVAVDAGGRVYVTNNGDATITVYAAIPSGGGTLNEAPVATIHGSNTGMLYPDGIALDSSGKIYIANNGPNSVTVYAANPVGTLNETPLATIAGSNTNLLRPEGIAVDASGVIYVSNYGSTPYPYNGSITVFAANPSGTLNETPVGTIYSNNYGLNNPTSIAVPGTGGLTPFARRRATSTRH